MYEFLENCNEKHVPHILLDSVDKIHGHVEKDRSQPTAP